MKNRMEIPAFFIPAFLTFLLFCGCRHSPTPRFYLIRSEIPLSKAVEKPSAPVIGLRPIALADYLDRPQIVLRKGEREIEYSQFDRWAEPLETQISTSLADSLGGRLKSYKVVSFPWRDAFEPDMEISISIFQLDGVADGPIRLRADWVITPGSGKKGIIAEKRCTLTAKCPEPGMPGVVAATENLLDQLSQEIADAVIKHSN